MFKTKCHWSGSQVSTKWFEFLKVRELLAFIWLTLKLIRFCWKVGEKFLC